MGIIIGIAGLAGSGKDATADFFVKNHGFVKVALADPLKRIAREVFGFTVEQLWGPSECRNTPDFRWPCPSSPGGYLTPRFALQQLGSEWGRRCSPDVWVEYMLRTAKELLGPFGRSYHPSYGLEDQVRYGVRNPLGVVVSDVRFANECAAIKKSGGVLIRMLRGHGLEGAAGAHVSETSLGDIPPETFDYILDNREWTLEQLEIEVGKVGKIASGIIH